MSWSLDNRNALENDGVRLDVLEKVTGRAKYTTDYYPENMLWAGYIRCPYGIATIKTIDEDAAKKVPGVLEVTIERRDGRYCGDRLGWVCAESRTALEEGLAALKMTFDLQPPKTDIDKEKTPLDQIPAPQRLAETEAALASAKLVHEATYDTQVQTHSALEPHIGVVDFRGDHAIAWGSTQGTFGFRNDLSQTLQLPQDKVEFHCEYVGGGFGAKFGAGPEGTLAAQMSKKYNRPCRVGVDRKEQHLDTGNRPGSMQYMKFGVDATNKIIAARLHSWGSVGPSGGGGGVNNQNRYGFGTFARSHQDVRLTAGFPKTFRAPGHPQGMFALEMVMEELAAKLGIDSLEFRIQNELSEVRKEMLKVGAELIGWKDRPKHGQSPGPIKRGIGCAVGDWNNGPGQASVTVNVYRTGVVEVLNGAQDIGTGFRTLIADCVVSQIGIERKFITSKVGVSTYPPGPASGGSVTSRSVAPKALNAASQAKAGVLALVAAEWKVDAATLAIKDGIVASGDRRMNWEDACKLITDDHLTFTANQNGEFYPNPTRSEAVQFVDLTVDIETGIVKVKKVVAIQDVGQAVNRNLVENQITGAVIQGVSYTLFENRILDRKTGAMVNANFDMYKIAGSMDVPEIIPIVWKQQENASVNSLGEPPAVPVPGAIGTAVYNAIGVPVRSMPITPDKVLAALAKREVVS